MSSMSSMSILIYHLSLSRNSKMYYACDDTYVYLYRDNREIFDCDSKSDIVVSDKEEIDVVFSKDFQDKIFFERQSVVFTTERLNLEKQMFKDYIKILLELIITREKLLRRMISNQCMNTLNSFQRKINKLNEKSILDRLSGVKKNDSKLSLKLKSINPYEFVSTLEKNKYKLVAKYIKPYKPGDLLTERRYFTEFTSWIYVSISENNVLKDIDPSIYNELFKRFVSIVIFNAIIDRCSSLILLIKIVNKCENLLKVNLKSIVDIFIESNDMKSVKWLASLDSSLKFIEKSIKDDKNKKALTLLNKIQKTYIFKCTENLTLSTIFFDLVNR